MRKTADPEALAESTGPDWVKIKGFDIAGEGDVKQIREWKKTHTID